MKVKSGRGLLLGLAGVNFIDLWFYFIFRIKKIGAKKNASNSACMTKISTDILYKTNYLFYKFSTKISQKKNQGKKSEKREEKESKDKFIN